MHPSLTWLEHQLVPEQALQLSLSHARPHLQPASSMQ
jgi:hypothetical protein